MQHSKPQKSTTLDTEDLQTGDHNIKIETAEILETAGRTLRNADMSTQGDDISKLINRVEDQVRNFKDQSGLKLEHKDAELQEKASPIATNLAGHPETFNPIACSPTDLHKISIPAINHPFGPEKLIDSMYQPWLEYSR
jgi:hypothetical protein